MKKNLIKNWSKYFLGVCALSGTLLFTSCQNDGREDVENDYGTEMEVGEELATDEVVETDVEYVANEDYVSPVEESISRDYDAKEMGTAATNIKPMEPVGVELADEDFDKVQMEYDEVNEEIREALRKNPGVTMRYTDNNKTSDYNNTYYGVYYDGLTDENARKQFQELEKRRTDLQNKMRGKMDNEKKTFVTAEVDAVPAKGYDELYSFIDEQIEYPVNAQAAEIEGTIFVEFIIMPDGTITSPSIIETISGDQTDPKKAPLNPTRVEEKERLAAIERMEEEAIEAVKATNGMWQPAMMGNEKVAQEVQLPVRFRLAYN